MINKLKFHKEYKRLLGWFLIIVFTDQSIKLALRTFTDFYVINKGVSFSLFENSHIFVFLASVTSIFLIIYLMSQNGKKLALLLILAGGISNLIDRIILGGVIDYIPFFSLFRFNLADVIISVGVVIMLVDVIKDEILIVKNKVARKSSSTSL